MPTSRATNDNCCGYGLVTCISRQRRKDECEFCPMHFAIRLVSTPLAVLMSPERTKLVYGGICIFVV